MKTQSNLKKFEKVELKTDEQPQLKGGTPGIIFLGIGAFFGKVNWGLALTSNDTNTESSANNDQA